MSGWIKCSDRIPDEGDLVDCWAGEERIPDCKIKDGEWHYWSEAGDHEYWPHFEPYKNKEANPDPITHWMPLPGAPIND